MFRSISRLGPKFIKTKDYIFEDKASIQPNIWKTYIAFISVIAVGFGFLSQFAIPTPDIQYDMKEITSPTFYQYVRTHGKIYHEPYLKSTLRSYYIGRGKVEEKKYMADYKSAFFDGED